MTSGTSTAVHQSASLSPVELERAKRVIDEIISLAGRTDRFCFYTFDNFMVSKDEAIDVDHVNLVLDQLRETIQRIGWMADLTGSILTGGRFEVGDADEWMLSPAYNRLKQEGAPSGDTGMGMVAQLRGPQVASTARAAKPSVHEAERVDGSEASGRPASKVKDAKKSAAREADPAYL